VEESLTVVEWFGEFFRALPDAGRALYQFGDPGQLGRGYLGVVIMALWFGPLLALPLFIAKITYGKHEWVSAAMGCLAMGSALWWIHGILPHAWIQFTQNSIGILEGPIIPASAGINVSEDYRIDLASNLYNVIAESVVAGLMVGGIAVTLFAFIRIQRMLPKTLAAGEVKPESGGYK
jgi:hypothetical protein